MYLQAMPCKTKCLNRRTCHSSAPPVLQSPTKWQNRMKWTNQQMKAAIEAVKSGGGVNRAAIEHGIPPTTLKDHLNGRVKQETSGRPRYLSQEEKNKLSTFLKQCSSVGLGKTRQDIMKIVESVAKGKKSIRSVKITQGWWRRYLERQKALKLRRGDNTAHTRMDAVNAYTMNHYFDLLKDTLEEHRLMSVEFRWTQRLLTLLPRWEPKGSLSFHW